jgi:formylglycine-generating enzyme required for sulfatase activity
MGKFEVSNAQYALCDPVHDSGVISMHNKDHDQRGYPVNGPNQPVVRISWEKAMAYCKWLTNLTGEKFTLPTEAQWEYACRAGSAQAFAFGDKTVDYATFANLGDASLQMMAVQGCPARPVKNPNPMLDWVPKDMTHDDKCLVTADVGKYQPNAWGLNDMHGNAAEWTLSDYKPYPYNAADGRDAGKPEGEKVARGGSWFDRPMRCRSGFRLNYPFWQGVYNVGFRVISDGRTSAAVAAVPVAAATK